MRLCFYGFIIPSKEHIAKLGNIHTLKSPFSRENDVSLLKIVVAPCGKAKEARCSPLKELLTDFGQSRRLLWNSFLAQFC